MFRIFRFLRLAFAGVLLVVVGTIFLVRFVWTEVVRELNYRREYGAAWRTEYEHYHGSLSQVHLKEAVAVLSLLAVAAILTWVCYQLRRNQPRQRRRK